MKSISNNFTTIPLFIISFVVVFTINHQLNAQSFSLGAMSDLVRVFEDGYQLPSTSDTVKTFGILGEVVSGQFVIRATQDLSDVTINITNLTDRIGNRTLAENAIEWNFVGSIPLTENAPNQPASELVRAAPAMFPDYLMQEKSLDIAKGTFKAVWLTIHIPASATAGIYSGEIIVQSKQESKSLALELTIYPFSLPKERHLKVTEWYTTRYFEQFHGIKEKYSSEWYAMLKIYADNLVAHRQNIFQVPMNAIDIAQNDEGVLEFDFTHFDNIAQVFWDTEQMDYLETGELTRFGEEKWFSTDLHLKDFTIENDKGEEIRLPGDQVVPHLLPAFENHLRAKGWLKKTLFHVKDEPTLRNVTAWKEWSSYMHHLAPDLTRIDALETTHLFDDIEIAVPKLDYLGAWYDVYKEAARNGTELWMYTVGIYQAGLYPNKTIDVPIMDSRVLHWLNYKFDLKGFLHWGWNVWYTEDPYKETGMHIGDGWHVYPVKDGVLNSLRWEQMRNGIQDFEYLWMLENKMQLLKDSLGSRFSWIHPAQRSKEIATRVVQGLSKHTNDAEVLYEAKQAIIGELQDFNKPPLTYIQTNPPEHSHVRGQSYLLEVFGYVEPGSRVVINDEEVPVNGHGEFLWNLKMTKENTQVIIQAENSKGSKRIIRDFLVD